MKNETPKAAPVKAAQAFDQHDVSGQTLADLLGLTRQSILRLKQNGTITQNGRRGRYDIFECVPRYVQSIKTGGTAEAGERLKIAQRKKIEAQNEAAAALVVPLADVAGILNASAAGFLAAWRALPRRIASKLAVLRDAKACRELIEDESAKSRLELFTPMRKFYRDRGATLPDVLAATFDISETPAPKSRKVGRRKSNPAKRKRRTRAVAKR